MRLHQLLHGGRLHQGHIGVVHLKQCKHAGQGIGRLLADFGGLLVGFGGILVGFWREFGGYFLARVWHVSFLVWAILCSPSNNSQPVCLLPHPLFFLPRPLTFKILSPLLRIWSAGPEAFTSDTVVMVDQSYRNPRSDSK